MTGCSEGNCLKCTRKITRINGKWFRIWVWLSRSRYRRIREFIFQHVSHRPHDQSLIWVNDQLVRPWLFMWTGIWIKTPYCFKENKLHGSMNITDACILHLTLQPALKLPVSLRADGVRAEERRPESCWRKEKSEAKTCWSALCPCGADDLNMCRPAGSEREREITVYISISVYQ